MSEFTHDPELRDRVIAIRTEYEESALVVAVSRLIQAEKRVKHLEERLESLLIEDK